MAPLPFSKPGKVVKVRPLLVAALALVGLALIAVGIVYFVEPAKHLPSFFPAHAHTHVHAIKHGAAAVVVGVVALVLAFVVRPRARVDYRRS